LHFPGGGRDSESTTSGLHVGRSVERTCGEVGTGKLMKKRVHQTFEEIRRGDRFVQRSFLLIEAPIQGVK
jgi:hypothetical protein